MNPRIIIDTSDIVRRLEIFLQNSGLLSDWVIAIDQCVLGELEYVMLGELGNGLDFVDYTEDRIESTDIRNKICEIIRHMVIDHVSCLPIPDPQTWNNYKITVTELARYTIVIDMVLQGPALLTDPEGVSDGYAGYSRFTTSVPLI